MNLNELKDSAGKYPSYAWPGGYPLFYVTSDGDLICPKCVNDSKNAFHTDGEKDSWTLAAYDINYEDASLYCDVCCQRIESAYAEEN